MPSVYIIPFLALGACMVLSIGTAGAVVLEEDTLTRDHEPVVLEGRQMPLLSQNTVLNDYIFCYAYGDDGWTQVILQIDERDNEDDDYFRPDQINGRMDDNDELVFMSFEAGHRVSPSEWLKGANQSYRYEIELVDGRDPERKAWVYFYISGTLEHNTEIDYIDYTTSTYILDTDIYMHDNHDEMPHCMVDLMVKEEGGGNGEDFLDRMKMRTKLFSWSPATTEEDIDIDWKHVVPIDGQVRILTRYWTTLAGVVDMTMITNRNYRSLNVVNTYIFKGFIPITIYSQKHCYDYDYRKTGMIHYDDGGDDPDYNVDIIDGSGGGNPDVREPIMNWYETTSPEYGSFVVITDLSDLDAERFLRYYNDSGYLGDDDTGDGWQWGETGYETRKVSNRRAADVWSWAFHLPARSLEEGPWGPDVYPLYAHPIEVDVCCQEYETDLSLSAFSAEWLSEGSIVLSWHAAATGGPWDIIRLLPGEDVSQRCKIATVRDECKWIDSGVSSKTSPSYWIADAGEEDAKRWTGPVRALNTTDGARPSGCLSVSPNPCNPLSTISFDVHEHESASSVSLRIYNQSGKLIATLCSNRCISPGRHLIRWNGRDATGQPASTGVYIARLVCGDRREDARIIILR
jgi:hypothetical protein